MVRLGFNQGVDYEIFTGKGIDLIDEWLNLENDDVNTLLRNVRKYGGVVQGEMISFKAEMNLRLSVFLVCHKHNTS